MHALVTGGAGFIGSHLVDALVAAGSTVRVLDDLSMGLKENVAEMADLIVGDITDPEAVRAAADGVDVIFHQAARTSVPRSVEDPLATDRVNAHGTLTILNSARELGIRRVVAASSSSVYGGRAPLPASESFPPSPRSPYAVSKLAGEHYCQVFADLFGLETVSLRYFNVYGPRQRADSPYAAVIPKFVDALRAGERPIIHGDGLQTRDFTFVGDVVQANLLAAAARPEHCAGQSYNVAGGGRHSLLDMLAILGGLLGVTPDPLLREPRAGDIRDSEADLSAIRRDLGYEPAIGLAKGLKRLVEEG